MDGYLFGKFYLRSKYSKTATLYRENGNDKEKLKGNKKHFPQTVLPPLMCKRIDSTLVHGRRAPRKQIPLT